MSEIRKDQKAKLSFKTADNTEQELDCFIKSISKDRLSLSFPQEMLAFARYLDEGQEVPVKIYTPAGIKMFDSMVLNSPLEKDFVIEYVEDHIEIQRREYSRAILETKVIIERKDADNILTHTIDIGGGGLRFFYKGRFSPNEKVQCRLYLPLQVASIVADGHISTKPHLQEFEHLVIFDRITEHDRDRIIQKCFELEASTYKEI